MDKESDRKTELLDFFHALGFEMLNESTKHTYNGPTGKSTIDLVFSNNSRRTKSLSITPSMVRKHSWVNLEYYYDNHTDKQVESNEKKSFKRQLNVEKLKNLLTNTKLNPPTTDDDRILLQTVHKDINELILNSKTKDKNTKPWFDGECFRARIKCKNLSVANSPEYNNCKKAYKELGVRTSSLGP
jgi:hypothetical protein